MQRANPSAMPPMAALDTPPWAAAFGALVVALLLQTTILHAAQFRGGIVSWVFLVVVWFAVRGGPARGALFGLCAGVCEDAVAGDTTAAWTVATPLVAAAVGRLSPWIGAANPLGFAALAGAAALARIVVYRLILQAQGLPPGFDATNAHAALWSALLDALAACLILVLFPRLRPLHVDRR
jgi:rod shape-determining protein MreD